MADNNSFVSPVHLTGVLNVVVQALSKWLKNHLNTPRCKVYRTSVQLVGNNTISAIIWPAPGSAAPFDYEINGDFWQAGQPSRLIAPVTGWYHIEFNAQFDTNATGIRFFGITQNGNIVAQYNSVGNATWVVGAVVSTDLYLTAGEYVEGIVYHTAGVAINVSNTYPIWMTMHLIARA